MQATIIGNLTADPDLQFIPSGAAKATFRIAENRRYKDRNGEYQEETSFWTVIAWRGLAENAVESLKRGDRVIAVGRLETRGYETAAGEKRTVTEMTADSIGPDLRWATVDNVTKANSGNGGNGARAPQPQRRAPQPANSSADEFDPYNPADSPF
jgi:single-strand DNA-binding protein